MSQNFILMYFFWVSLSHFRKILLFLLIGSSAISVNAQNKYTEKTGNDSLQIMYKWKFPEKKGVEQPAELLLKVINKQDVPVALSFEVVYSMDLRTVATFVVDTCLKAKKTIYGKLNGLYFISEDLTNEQIRSDGFVWEINDLAVQEIEKCPVDK